MKAGESVHQECGNAPLNRRGLLTGVVAAVLGSAAAVNAAAIAENPRPFSRSLMSTIQCERLPLTVSTQWRLGTAVSGKLISTMKPASS